MDFLLFFLSIFSLSFSFISAISFTEYIYPNFTASNLRFIDTSGSFLFSSNGTFKASIFNPGNQQSRFYFCVIHTESNTVVWSANRDFPVSKSGIMSFTVNGIRINEEDGSFKWSTPPLNSLVSALKLTESGNLLLLDQSNKTLWESFRNPTDTIVIGQKLFIGNTLLSSVSSDDLSTGNYGFGLTLYDAVLQWKNLTYWKMSMDTSAFVNANYGVEFMEINQTGLYLFSKNGSSIVIRVDLPPSEFRVAKMDHLGQFIVVSFSNATSKRDFLGPIDQCRIPLICWKIGLCTNGVSAYNPVCSCPMNFRATSNNTNSCVPADSSYSLPGSCNNRSGLSSLNLAYLQLGYGVDYFANDFTRPANYGVNLTYCQYLCSQDCSCLGVFHENSSGSCYKLEDNLGSLTLRTTSNGRLGFVKTIVKSPNIDGFDEDESGFPTVAVVLLPVSGLIFLLAIGSYLCRKYNNVTNVVKNKTIDSYSNSPSFEDLEFSIPGLPLKFEYEELQAATDNFKTKIGTGGYGTVYKGILPDKTLVAVKRIMSLGLRGKEDFCTEIAVIGNIHHVNLVKLKGYCAKKNQWLLVYEYMNHGSLDKTLFGHGPVLEWQERVDIAIGAARGIAYLHSGCEHKIIHCDVKPENILLHDHFQAKISDFGLSKLLNREESCLFTTMRGTRGYLAPEWLTSSSISDKTDVYSFGMVLLELVSGRKNCLSTKSDKHNSENSLSASVQEIGYFPLYALEMHEKGKYLELVDKRLEGRVRSEEVEKLVRVALCCVHEEPGLRPSMGSVVGMLEGEMPVGEPRVESLNFLRFYGRRFAEASGVDETGWFNNDVVVYNEDANGCHSSHGSMSNTCFSRISSQQISGPR